MSEYYIPSELRDVIRKHIYRNVLADIDTSFDAPLLLVIAGPSGSGKTFAVHEVLNELGVNIDDMNGSEFESGEAGAPAKELLRRYDAASKKTDETKKPTVIVIDDADSIIGNFGPHVQYTVNTQMVNKIFLDLADHPKEVHKMKGKEFGDITFEKKSVNRVPIIFTCNDSQKFYGPLMRPGRTTIFSWVPSSETVSHVVSSIFNIESEKSSLLVNSLNVYANEVDAEKYRYGVPVSTFSDINTMLMDDFILKVASEISLDELLGNRKATRELISDRSDGRNVDVQTLIEIGKAIIQKDVCYI